MNILNPPNPLLFPQTMVVPPNAGPRNYAQSMNPNSAGAPMTSHIVGDWPENGVIQKGFVMRPFGEKHSATLIRQGQLVFVRRGNSVVRGDKYNSDDAQEFTLVNLGQLNMVLQDNYELAAREFAPILERGRGMPGRDRVDALLAATELTHDELYREYFEDAFGGDLGGQTARERDNVNRFRFLLQQFSQTGIRQQWSWLGTAITSSSPAPQSMGEMPYFPLNVAFKGPQLLQNVWGVVSGSGTDLYLVWKRRPMPDNSDDYGAFAAVPYSTGATNYVPGEAREYLDASGALAYGAVERVGLVQDSKGAPPSELQRSFATGLSPDASPEAEFQATASLAQLDVHVYRNARNRWVYCPF